MKGLKSKEIRPTCDHIYPLLDTNERRNWHSCNVGSYGIMWGTLFFKRLLFKGIQGLLYHNELNERAQK